MVSAIEPTLQSGMALLRAEMDRQAADAIASIGAGAGVARQVADSIRRTGRLVLLGMGASHWVNRTAEVLYRRAGIDVVAHPLSEVLLVPLPATKRTVLLTSQSGRSGEVVRYLDLPQDGEERFGLTLDPSGDLARRVPCLVGHGGVEVAFAATRSLLVSHALHHAILAELGYGGEEGVAALREPAPVDIGPALATLAGARDVLLTARAELVGVAEAGGLCLMELGRRPTLALEGGQLRHGPMEVLGPSTGIVALRGVGPSAELTAGLGASCRAAGAPCVVLDTSGAQPVADATVLRLPRRDGYAAVFTVVPPLLRLLVERAATQVADVGVPVRSSKVTTDP